MLNHLQLILTGSAALETRSVVFWPASPRYSNRRGNRPLAGQQAAKAPEITLPGGSSLNLAEPIGVRLVPFKVARIVPLAGAAEWFAIVYLSSKDSFLQRFCSTTKGP